MRTGVKQYSPASVFRRVVDLWPYLFVAICLVGLAYIALNNIR